MLSLKNNARSGSNNYYTANCWANVVDHLELQTGEEQLKDLEQLLDPSQQLCLAAPHASWLLLPSSLFFSGGVQGLTSSLR
jgi:hypothetical protein